MDPFQLVVERPDTAVSEPPVYANVVHVSSTPYDFRLTFSILETQRDGIGDGDVLPVAPSRLVSEIVLPAAAVDSLMDLIRAELDRYTARYGAPRPALQQASR